MTVSNHLIDDGRGSEISVNCALCSHYPAYCAGDSGAAVLVILSPHPQQQQPTSDDWYLLSNTKFATKLQFKQRGGRIRFLSFYINTVKLTNNMESECLSACLQTFPSGKPSQKMCIHHITVLMSKSGNPKPNSSLNKEGDWDQRQCGAVLPLLLSLSLQPGPRRRRQGPEFC